MFQVPNEDERAEIMDGLLQNVSYSGDLSGQYLAQRTAVGSLVLFIMLHLLEMILEACSTEQVLICTHKILYLN